MQCEMCGKKIFNAKTILIEGTELQVCNDCLKFGKVKKSIKKHSSPIHESKKNKNNKYENNKNNIDKYKKYYKNIDIDDELTLFKDYKERIKKKREHLNLKQEELAKKLNIKENLIHRIETGHIYPNISLIKKLESFLNIRLIDTNINKGLNEPPIKNNEVYVNKKENKSNMIQTIGNSIQIRIRKKR